MTGPHAPSQWQTAGGTGACVRHGDCIRQLRVLAAPAGPSHTRPAEHTRAPLTPCANGECQRRDHGPQGSAMSQLRVRISSGKADQAISAYLRWPAIERWLRSADRSSSVGSKLSIARSSV